MYKYICKTHDKNFLMCTYFTTASPFAASTKDVDAFIDEFIDFQGVNELNGPFDCEFTEVPYSSSTAKSIIYKCANKEHNEI